MCPGSKDPDAAPISLGLITTTVCTPGVTTILHQSCEVFMDPNEPFPDFLLCHFRLLRNARGQRGSTRPAKRISSYRIYMTKIPRLEFSTASLCLAFQELPLNFFLSDTTSRDLCRVEIKRSLNPATTGRGLGGRLGPPTPRGGDALRLNLLHFLRDLTLHFS